MNTKKTVTGVKVLAIRVRCKGGDDMTKCVVFDYDGKRFFVSEDGDVQILTPEGVEFVKAFAVVEDEKY